MQTQRITIPSLFTVVVSVSVCLLAFEAHAQTLHENLSARASTASQPTHACVVFDKGFHAVAIKKLGSDEAVIFNNLNASSNNETVVVTFSMRRDTFTALLSRMLATY